jgi:hypothetical protein
LWKAHSRLREEKTVSNSWLFYVWVGKCFSCVFRCEGHPFESRDGSYVEYYNIDLAINNFMQTQDVLSKIRKDISSRKPKQEEEIILKKPTKQIVKAEPKKLQIGTRKIVLQVRAVQN